ncbi:MAG: sulfur transferase domain-containing protein [Gammaproteobacteria bacterium]|nr:sulfur transferase domain-containing protein [Gammaproteobacteria bacterium]
MKIRLLVVFLLGSCAIAGEPEAEPLTSLKVDIAEVAAAGDVLPVDGITSSGQPDADALKVFRDSGYAAVIDLRGDAENRGLDERAVVEKLGMQYVPFPVVGRDAINFDTAKQLDQLIQDQHGPVLIHCGSGNRVGAMLALIKSLDGADDEQAILIGKEGGLTRLEPVVRERLRDKSTREE